MTMSKEEARAIVLKDFEDALMRLARVVPTQNWVCMTDDGVTLIFDNGHLRLGSLADLRTSQYLSEKSCEKDCAKWNAHTADLKGNVKVKAMKHADALELSRKKQVECIEIIRKA